MAIHDEEQRITGALDDLGAGLRRETSVREEVMRRVTQHSSVNGAPLRAASARWGGAGCWRSASRSQRAPLSRC